MTKSMAVIAPSKPPEMAEDVLPMAVVTPFDLPPETFRQGLERRKANRSALIEWVRSALVEGADFGSIRIKGKLSKPSLFKPGAEKICGMLGVSVHFPNAHTYDQLIAEGKDVSSVIIRCQLKSADGQVVAEGIGARKIQQDFGDLNKCLKMASKSSQIDAVLRLAGLSEVFTQDLEDGEDNESDAAKKIDDEKLKAIKAALYRHKVHSGKFRNWLGKYCAAKGFQDIDDLERIPAELHEQILAKIPDFADTAGAENNL